MNTPYKIIEKYYGDACAKRSQVPYINHINEGLVILDYIGASQFAKDAYCLHPILQSDEDFLKNMDFNFGEINTKTIILAMEYRRVANSYLSKNDPEDFVGLSCREVTDMLIADKVQNYKDFLVYHKGIHPRTEKLDFYFNTWFKILEVDYKKLSKAIK